MQLFHWSCEMKLISFVHFDGDYNVYFIYEVKKINLGANSSENKYQIMFKENIKEVMTSWHFFPVFELNFKRRKLSRWFCCMQSVLK